VISSAEPEPAAHAAGILAYYYTISTGPLEATNNKIKTMQRHPLKGPLSRKKLPRGKKTSGFFAEVRPGCVKRPREPALHLCRAFNGLCR